MSDKLEEKFNKIIALLATTQTPTRKVARGQIHHLSNMQHKKRGMSTHLAA
jgi:hypothetical protein